MADQPKSESPHQPISKKHSYPGKVVHPTLVANYTPKQQFKIPLQGDAKHYGSLTDESPFAEYAWEFLRRNRFYQAMIDDVNPSFNLDQWGYSAGPGHVSSCGLAEPYKHYAESYTENPPVWWPLWAIETRLQDTLKSRKFERLDNDYPGLQVPFMFDVSPVFGPGSMGLQMQADLAVMRIEKYLKSRNKPTPRGLVYRPGKPKLRILLRLADLLSYPQKVESEGIASKAPQSQMINATQAAGLLGDFNFNDADGSTSHKTQKQREESTFDRVENARAFIYEWHCLTLLTFASQEKEPPKKRKTSPTSNT